MGRPTKAGSELRKAECQHIEFILSISKHSTEAAQSLGVTLRSLYIRLSRGEISSMKINREEIKLHHLSTPHLSLREFRTLVVQDAVRNSTSIAEAAKLLGTSVKTIHVYMGGSRPDPGLLRKKPLDPKDLPESFKNQKPDRPIVRNERTKENLEVSVWVSPEERDTYYNYDYPWGTYGSRPSKRIYPGDEKPLTHALGYGEDL